MTDCSPSTQQRQVSAAGRLCPRDDCAAEIHQPRSAFKKLHFDSLVFLCSRLAIRDQDSVLQVKDHTSVATTVRIDITSAEPGCIDKIILDIAETQGDRLGPGSASRS